MYKYQIFGILLVITFFLLGVFWEKDFQYSSILDFIFGVISAIGLAFTLKIFPIKKKN